MLQRVCLVRTKCRSVFKGVAVCCSVLQSGCRAIKSVSSVHSVRQYVQNVAVCCSVLQCGCRAVKSVSCGQNLNVCSLLTLPRQLKLSPPHPLPLSLSLCLFHLACVVCSVGVCAVRRRCVRSSVEESVCAWVCACVCVQPQD